MTRMANHLRRLAFIVLTVLMCWTISGNATVLDAFVLWNRFGDEAGNMAFCTTILSDGTFLIGSNAIALDNSTSSDGRPAQDGLCAWIDLAGNAVGQYRETPRNAAGGHLSIQLIHESETDFILLVHNDSPIEDYIVRLYNDGTTERITNLHEQYSVSVQAAIDTGKGMLVSGSMHSPPEGSGAWAAFINDDGQFLWDYRGDLLDEVHFPYATFNSVYDDCFYLLTHQTYPLTHCVIELSASGEKIREVPLGSVFEGIFIQGFDVINGNMLFFGTDYTTGSDIAWACAISLDGILQWERTYDGYLSLQSFQVLDEGLICVSAHSDAQAVVHVNAKDGSLTDLLLEWGKDIVVQDLILDPEGALWAFGSITEDYGRICDVFVGKTRVTLHDIKRMLDANL